ncbi:uncharacterized protein BX663DRAFT_496918 [Cokeromyces recurvatus]|uniref:uncharacterized protein n=1 Tax=Cokeromyces recurvatus TaxID=90255 RepID=UPI00221ED4DB|nr:uncharacterized protein BX663DRAFT_496918 [Cokeromyces recurvatus]KAI7906563.1 hypothetical protein BX663DRAFT_496918 [Cokeromyces recurvatus]
MAVRMQQMLVILICWICYQTKNKKRKKNKGQSGFAEDYQVYWADRRNKNTQTIITERQNKTLEKLNDMTCESLERLAEWIYSDDGVGSSSSSSNIIVRNPVRTEDSNKFDGLESLEKILNFSSKLSSDKVGYLGILDLSSDTVILMLKKQLAEKDYNDIIQHATLLNVELTEYAEDLITSLCESKLATISLRNIMYEIGYRQAFNLVLNRDAGFIETTTRHFLDLMDSPNNSLIQTTGERAACIHTIIYIINQLFLADNDVVALDWIEKEYCQTGRCKWDGIIMKVNNKKISTVFVEFSGGIKVNATMKKENL